MASSDSGDEKTVEQPSRKKRKAAEIAEANFQRLDQDEDEEDNSDYLNEGVTSRSRISTSRGAIGVLDKSDDESDEGSDDNEEIFGGDLDSDDGGSQAGKSVSSKSGKRKASGAVSVSEYHDFSPPPFLQKILEKRQKELDEIRRQLPVDSRSREKKLADWYMMLSKLDKPVALLSLITPHSQQD